MDRTEMLQLMHAVLDGVASSEERAALDRVLAQDPQARTQFAELQRLFGALDGMPRVEPPEGFADDVMAALQRSTAKGASTRQPFAQSGVIGPTGSDIRVRAPSKPITARTPSGPMWGRQDMSKRGYWIMGGVAAAVLALFVGTSVDFPASGDKAAGTIVPAERVRNAQPSADDVKLGQPGTERRPSPPVPLATGNSNLGAAGNSNLGAAGNSNLGAAGNSNLGAAGNSNLGAAGNSNLGAAATATSVPRATATSGRPATATSVPRATATWVPPATATSVPRAAATSVRPATATSVRRGNSNLGAAGNSNLGAAGNSNLGARQQQPRCGGQQQPRCGGQQQPRCGGQQQPRCGGQQQPRCGGQQQPRCGGQQQPRCRGQPQPRLERREVARTQRKSSRPPVREGRRFALPAPDTRVRGGCANVSTSGVRRTGYSGVLPRERRG